MTEEEILNLYEYWWSKSLNADAEEIEKEFGVPSDTLKKWRYAKDKSGPTYFKYNQTIKYPRKMFILWYAKHMQNKQSVKSQPGPTEINLKQLRK
jgi:hypothetical protein